MSWNNDNSSSTKLRLKALVKFSYSRGLEFRVCQVWANCVSLKINIMNVGWLLSFTFLNIYVTKWKSPKNTNCFILWRTRQVWGNILVNRFSFYLHYSEFFLFIDIFTMFGCFTFQPSTSDWDFQSNPLFRPPGRLF